MSFRDRKTDRRSDRRLETSTPNSPITTYDSEAWSYTMGKSKHRIGPRKRHHKKKGRTVGGRSQGTGKSKEESRNYKKMYQRQHRKTYKQLLESTRASMGARIQDLEARLGDDYDPDMDEAGYIALASKFGAAQDQLNAAKDVLVRVSSECVYAYVPVDFYFFFNTRRRLRRTPNPAPTPTDCALGPRARRGACALVRAGLGGGD